MKKTLLDHGYIELIETWGGDERIIEAARQSTQKGFLGWGSRCTGTTCALAGEALREGITECPQCGAAVKNGDEKLLRYLWEHKHSTPFEFAGAVIEVQAPLVVFREWHRHRTQSYSEASARYAPLPDLNYVPTVDRVMVGTGGTNKQAGALKGSEALTQESAEVWLSTLTWLYERAEQVYQDGLKAGVPKELARLALPVGRYSRMRATANLRNWMGFLALRMDPNAQWEIREYANALYGMLCTTFPRTMQLFGESMEAAQ